MVYLIGAGPGDPELMTLKAVRALRAADVILVDALVNPACLEHARPDARVIKVGKRAGSDATQQAHIEKLLVFHARQGRVVARLKGGDPFVFGRGGEEAERLRAQGFDVVIVPGLTSGIAVPAALGIPVTHRDLAHGVTFLTGHGVEHDWDALVRSGTTLVIYMGSRRLSEIRRRLVGAGMAPDTPACAIANGTLATQRHVVSTLAHLSTETLTGPIIIVIGEVVRLGCAVEQSAPARAA